MKYSRNYFPAAIFAVLFAMITMVSCTKELDRDKFIGTYDVVESCLVGDYSFSATITESGTNDDEIVISNFADTGENLVATVSGNSFTFDDTNGETNASGSGTIAGNILSMSYSTEVAGVNVNCTSVYTQK